MKRTISFIAGVFFLLSGMGAVAQETWSLQKCIDYAFENNIVIKQQQLNTEYNQNLVSQSKSEMLPNLNAGASNNYSYGRSLNNDNVYENVNSTQLNGYVSSNLTLFNGFILQNSVRQSKLNLQAAIEDMQKTKDDIILNIAASYLEILFAEELAQIAEAQIDVTEQQIERTQKLVEAGSLARGALLEIEAQLAREELQLVMDKNRIQLTYLNLYQLLELPIEKSFKIEKPKLPEIKAHVTMNNAFDVYKNALNTRPEIAAAQLRVESAKSELAVARGYRYPSLSVGGSYNNNYFNILNSEFNQLSFREQIKSNSRYGFGISLNIPIFNRFQVKNAVSNAKLQIQDYEYRLQTASNVLRKDIEQAYTNALAALNKYISAEKAVESMEEAFRYTEEKFNVGMINTVEYNESKNYLTVARSELLQARYEFIFRAKILDFYNGIPIEL
ncbi:MAG: TolC family protein [Mariniphaga sp.]